MGTAAPALPHKLPMSASWSTAWTTFPTPFPLPGGPAGSRCKAFIVAAWVCRGQQWRQRPWASAVAVALTDVRSSLMRFAPSAPPPRPDFVSSVRMGHCRDGSEGPGLGSNATFMCATVQDFRPKVGGHLRLRRSEAVT